MHTLGPFEIDGEEVVNVAIAGVPWSPRAHADRPDRVPVESPVEYIDVVNVLFDNMVATKPCKAVPIVDLISDIAHARLARSLPQNALIPVTAPAHKFTDGPVVDSLHRFDVRC